MFKLDFDPRVIGNKVMPDGSYKTGVGQFLRSSSLDEFPQFFNVLKGDMSIVGTRPPLESETNLYELHHRARLAIKPGITGMWQVSFLGFRRCETDGQIIVATEPWEVLGKKVMYVRKAKKRIYKKDGLHQRVSKSVEEVNATKASVMDLIMRQKTKKEIHGNSPVVCNY